MQLLVPQICPPARISRALQQQGDVSFVSPFVCLCAAALHGGDGLATKHVLALFLRSSLLMLLLPLGPPFANLKIRERGKPVKFVLSQLREAKQYIFRT